MYKGKITLTAGKCWEYFKFVSHLCSSLAITGNHIMSFLSFIYKVLSPSICKLNAVSKIKL